MPKALAWTVGAKQTLKLGNHVFFKDVPLATELKAELVGCAAAAAGRWCMDGNDLHFGLESFTSVCRKPQPSSVSRTNGSDIDCERSNLGTEARNDGI